MFILIVNPPLSGGRGVAVLRVPNRGFTCRFYVSVLHDDTKIAQAIAWAMVSLIVVWSHSGELSSESARMSSARIVCMSSNVIFSIPSSQIGLMRCKGRLRPHEG